MGFPCGSDGNESTFSAGDTGSIPGSGRSPGEGNGYPLQYPCLENSMARAHGVTKELGATKGLTHRQGQLQASQVALVVKNLPVNAGDTGSIPGSGRSPGGGHGNPFQYSCLENLHGQRSLEAYSPWCHQESGMTE